MTPDHLRKLFAKMTPDELADTLQYLSLELDSRHLTWSATCAGKAASSIRASSRGIQVVRGR